MKMSLSDRRKSNDLSKNNNYIEPNLSFISISLFRFVDILLYRQREIKEIQKIT